MENEQVKTFKQGVLILIVHEQFDTETMQTRSVYAKITNRTVEVLNVDSQMMVSNTRMTLAPSEILLIAEGVEMVRHFWETAPLAPGHVLLDCGCELYWDDTHPKKADTYPVRGAEVWCPDHEETKVYRVSKRRE